MGRKDKRNGNEEDNVRKAQKWGKDVDKTEDKINRTNKSDKSAEEKMWDLINEDDDE